MVQLFTLCYCQQSQKGGGQYSMSREPWRFLTYWREKLGLSPAELARRAGTSHQNVYRLEAGHRKPSDQWAQTFAEAMGINADELMPGAGVSLVELTWQCEVGRLVNEIELPPNQRRPMNMPLERDWHANERAVAEVVGDGMQPAFFDGDLLVCVPVVSLKRRKIESGNYAIVVQSYNRRFEVTVQAACASGDNVLYQLPCEIGESGARLTKDEPSKTAVALVVALYRRMDSSITK